MPHLLKLLKIFLLGSSIGVLLTFVFGSFQSEIEFRHIALPLIFILNAIVGLLPSIRKNRRDNGAMLGLVLVSAIIGVVLVALGCVLDMDFNLAFRIIILLQIVDCLIYFRTQLPKIFRRL